MKKLTAVLLILWLCLSACLAEEQPAPAWDSFVYGTSQQGRDLVCCRVGPQDAEKSMLMVFAVHGFEDEYDHDGRVLTDIAFEMLRHYSENEPAFVLYIIPCANPDAEAEGKSKNGFGRCNANGIDINRDFPVGWTRKTTARYKTGKAPFATAEACGIRDLVEGLHPTYAADIHGWLGCVYGTKSATCYFEEELNLKWHADGAGGKMSMWFATVTEGAVLVELRNNIRDEAYVTDTAARLIRALDRLMAGEKAE